MYYIYVYVCMYIRVIRIYIYIYIRSATIIILRCKIGGNESARATLSYPLLPSPFK